MSADGAPYLKKGFQRIVQDLLDDLASGQGGRVAITDSTPGSVVRTLVEAFSRELAVAYAQLDHVYRLGYLETAEGDALDLVVGLLGLTRRRGGHLDGTATFSRATPAPEAIAIPVCTALSGKKVPLVETTAAAFLRKGATEVTVPVVSVEPAAEPVPAGVLSILVQPLFGIEAATNATALVPRTRPETDDDLRVRARRRLDAARAGTISGLEAAVRERGYAEVRVEEPAARPGTIDITVGDEDVSEADLADIQATVERVRPAGIRVEVAAVRWVELRIEATLELARNMELREQQAIAAELAARAQAYVDDLGVMENVRNAKLAALLGAHDTIAALRLLKVTPMVGDMADTARLSTSGDVIIGPGERVFLERDGLTLHFEPPAPIVWIDVRYQLKPNTKEVDEADLGTAIQGLLTSLAPETTSLTWQAVWDDKRLSRKRSSISTLRLLLHHERDGLIVELANKGDADTLDPRESLRLRKVEREAPK